MYRRRLLEAKIQLLFDQFPVVCVLGARQVGKSTLIQETFRDRIRTVTFDPVLDLEDARLDPDFFLQNHPAPLFLDEIQYAPEVLGAIKRRVDRVRSNGQYILSGSQNLAVIGQISESLAGRVAILDLYAMSAGELAGEAGPSWIQAHLEGRALQNMDVRSPPDLPRMLWRGSMPGLLEKTDEVVPYFYDSYVSTYIERDVRVLADLGSLQDFGRFFGILAGLTATEINPAHIGRELGIDRKTALKWLALAHNSYQWFPVRAFSRNSTKKTALKNKGFFADTGLICSLQKISSPDALLSHPQRGRIFETYVFLEILKVVQELPVRPEFYHFRLHSGTEVDLILERDGTLFPIEIKMKAQPTRSDARSLRAFRELHGAERIAPGLLICAIPEPRLLAEEVLAIPYWMI
ncbi:MAG: ATP-binding protein [Spirochaetales bacterium]|nr:ATP-binding protein [Spirochaetales bacterium]